eukprot:jgi/Mesvir1/15253/Mv06474-RA.1
MDSASIQCGSVDCTACVSAVRERWVSLCQRLRLEDRVRDKWWAIILEKYSEKTRFYHTIEHLKELFELSDTYSHLQDRVDIIELTIIFHDIIYDPASSTNEEDSAALYLRFAKDIGQNQQDIEHVCQYILMTKSHTTDLALPQDMRVFLSCDLGVLAKPWDKYRTYAEQIRSEYAHVEAKAFCIGRSAVLRSFLSRPTVYAVPEIEETLGPQARANLNRELHILQAQLDGLQEHTT